MDIYIRLEKKHGRNNGMKKTVKKWVLLAGCIAVCFGGCGKTPEEKAEKLMEKEDYAKAIQVLEKEGIDSELLYQAKRGYKYAYFETEPSEKRLKSALKDTVTNDPYFQMSEETYSEEYAVCVAETDKEYIESILEGYYGTWYLEGTDKEYEFDEFELFGKEYGILYAFSGTYESEQSYYSDIFINLCYLDKPKEEIDTESSYYTEWHGDELLEYSLLTIDGKTYQSMSESEIEEIRAEAKKREQMQTLEEPVKNKTYEAAKEKISNIYEKEGKNTLLAYSEIVDYYIDYGEDTITCNMEIFYCESVLNAAFGLGENYYAVAIFKVKGNGDLTMISVQVD